MNDLTIIVPTHNRHEYLKRSIGYYSSYKLSVVFIDSSESPFDGDVPSPLKYVYCKGLTFSDKVLSALANIKSKYVAFCADDDFLSFEALEQGVDFLSSNKRVVGYLGSFWGYEVEFDDKFFPLKNRFGSNLGSDSILNVQSFMSNYQQVLWGLYKKEVIESAYSLIKKSQFRNDNFFEILIAMYCSFNGGIHVSQNLWCVREVNNASSWGRRHRSLVEVKGSQDFIFDFEALAHSLSSIMTYKQTQKALNAYLNSSRYRKLKLLRNKLFRGDITPSPPSEALKVISRFI